MRVDIFEAYKNRILEIKRLLDKKGSCEYLEQELDELKHILHLEFKLARRKEIGLVLVK